MDAFEVVELTSTGKHRGIIEANTLERAEALLAQNRVADRLTAAAENLKRFNEESVFDTLL
jgi:hypothetical protein